MRKIFFSIVLVLLIPILPVFAADNVSFFMANWVGFNSNDGVQELPTITVTDNTGGNITPANEISIILPKDTDILWDKSVGQITFNNSLVGVSYSKNLKSINIPVSKAFLAGETAVLKGQKVRVYGGGSGYQNLALDVNGDGVSDAVGVNGIQIDGANKRTDTLPPFSIISLTTKQDTTSATLSWENPVDPDLYNLILTRTLTRGTSTPVSTDITIDKLTSTYADTLLQAGDKLQYSIRAKDNVGNLSEPVITSVEIPLPEAPVPAVVLPVNEVAVEKKVGILDSVTEEDINNVLSKYIDINKDAKYLNELVYFVKTGVIKGAGKKIRSEKQLNYGQFSAFAVKAFSIEQKGSYFNSLKLLGYISPNIKPYTKITKKNAFKILLKLKGINYVSQTIVDKSTLKGHATLADIVVWSVKVIDQGNQGF